MPDIIELNRHGMIDRFNFSDYRDCDGVQVPFKVTSKKINSGVTLQEATTLVKDFTPQPPPPVAFKINYLDPSVSVVDRRLGTAVEYTSKELLALNGGSTDLGLEKILKFTRSKLGKGETQKVLTDRMIAAGKPRPPAPTPTLLESPLVVIGGIALILGVVGYLLSKFRR